MDACSGILLSLDRLVGHLHDQGRVVGVDSSIWKCCGHRWCGLDSNPTRAKRASACKTISDQEGA